MDTNLISILNKFTEISSVNNTGKSQKNSACDTSFETTMREQQINNTKEEIYNKFHVDVNNANGKFECYISSDVLYCQTANYNRVQQQIKIPSDTYQTARSCL